MNSLLTFHVFGGGIVNSLVAYKTWRAVGANEFPEFHHIDSALIILLFVVVFGCITNLPIVKKLPNKNWNDDSKQAFLAKRSYKVKLKTTF